MEGTELLGTREIPEVEPLTFRCSASDLYKASGGISGAVVQAGGSPP